MCFTKMECLLLASCFSHQYKVKLLMLETGRQTASQGVGALSSLTFQGTGGGDNLIPDEH